MPQALSASSDGSLDPGRRPASTRARAVAGGRPGSPFGIGCLIVARNLGDAAMTARVAQSLIESGRFSRLVVWTFPQARFLFDALPGCRVVVSDFPMGATLRHFGRGGWRSFVEALRTLRVMRPDTSIELVGDLRERLVAALIGARFRVSPAWHRRHPFRHHIRLPGPPRAGVAPVPDEVPNIYAAQRLILARDFGINVSATARMAAPLEASRRLTIGFHPFASHRCKAWPDACWREWLQQVGSRGHRIIGYCAPADRERLASLIPTGLANVALVTVPLPQLPDAMRQLDVLVGLDSFAVHLADKVGVRSVVLVGPNDPRVFTPPRATAVFVPAACPIQPCHGKPRCEGTSFEFACMRSIPVAAVTALAEGHDTATLSGVATYVPAPSGGEGVEPCATS